MVYYVIDTTLNKADVKQFLSYSLLVSYLEGMCERKFRQTRRDRMFSLFELGYGEDDGASVNFVRSMSEIFNVGVIRGDNLVKCDVTSIALFQKEEYGD